MDITKKVVFRTLIYWLRSALRHLPFSGHLAYSLIFWAIFALWIIAEGIASRLKRSSDPLKTHDHGSLTLIVVLWWTGIALDFLFAIFLPQAAIRWKRDGVFVVGIILMLCGMLLRLYSMTLLGRYFTFDVTVQTNQKIIDVGPYRYIRHPSYTGALLTLVGFGLALANFAGLCVAFACLALAYCYRIPIEESALLKTLGEPYRQYMNRTQMLVPFLF
jgi:protein-S-isoprenylcysteine O-methyltransferase Ste14